MSNRFIPKVYEGGRGKGGDGGDDGMESRVAKLEALAESTDKRLSLVETDLRSLSAKLDKYFLLGIAAIVGLAGLIAKGFGWL
ncbi:MAG: hypothetical protein CMO04_16225 [Thalassospira sp.]|nr:hypothetical protein [Thalassospira sp.]